MSSSITVLQQSASANSASGRLGGLNFGKVTIPASSSTVPSTMLPPAPATTLGPFQGPNIPSRKPAPINPLVQSCHQCGADLSHSHIAEDAQRRISELEGQVKILTTKATAAVDKLADYEDELRQLKTTKAATPNASATAAATTNSTTGSDSLSPNVNQRTASPRPAAPPSSTPSTRTFPSRLTSLLSSSSVSSAPGSAKRSQSQPPGTGSPPPSTSTFPTIHANPDGSVELPPSATELQALLTHEQTLRLAAERRVTQTNSELEELSAQLFTEANEMVAAERKARVKLEQRVEILEKREKEKTGRLELLERRVGRVERVRGILAGMSGGGGYTNPGMAAGPGLGSTASNSGVSSSLSLAGTSAVPPANG